MVFQPVNDVVAALIAFKAAEEEDDPSRIQDIRGPSEVLNKRLYGRYPEGSWNLRVEESRSGILWQALSGILDPYPSYASAYIALALDTTLSTEDYKKELSNLNRSWLDFLDRNSFLNTHTHKVISGEYHRVSCPQCSLLTAMAVQNKDMHDLFVRDLLPLKTPEDRMSFLRESGLLPLLDEQIPDTTQPSLIIR